MESPPPANGTVNEDSSSSSLDSKPTIHVDHRTERSVPMFLLHHLIKPFSAKLINSSTTYPAGSPKLEPHKTKKCDVIETVVEDIYLYDLVPKKKAVEKAEHNGRGRPDQRRRRLFYFCGGGWQMPASSDHWTMCSEMAVELPDIAVSIVSYPLAPSSPAPQAFGMMTKLYRKLLQDAKDAGEDVILAGDSAGGNIVLCLTLAALAEDEESPAPKVLLAISPSCDLRRSNPESKEIAPHDPILRQPFVKHTADQWRGEWDASDPRVSPLFADVSPLARRGIQVHGVTGSYDILCPDALLFRKKCEEAGVRGEWLQWDKQMHVFPLAYSYKLPESVEGKDWILDVLNRT